MSLDRRRTRSAASRGFTLIEVLVVVVIIAVATSIVLLSINVVGDDRDIEREALRLASLVELVADEAELQGRDFGIEFIRQGYRFVEYDPFLGSWSEVVGDDILRPRRLPENLEFALVVEDKRIKLDEQFASTDSGRDDEDDDDGYEGYAQTQSLRQPRGNLMEKYGPHSMILSSGDLSPFEATIARPADGTEEIVRVLPTGRITVGDEERDYDAG